VAGGVAAQEVGGSGGVAQVQVKGQSGSSWVGLRNSWGAAWEVNHAPNYPLDIRIVNDKGQEVRVSPSAAFLTRRSVLS